MQLPILVTDGPAPTPAPDDVTPLTNVSVDNTGSVRMVYPDPTPGTANPLRSVRVDGLAVGGANIRMQYTSPYDGTIRNVSALVNVFLAPNSGSAAFGTPSAPFPTPV